MPDTYYQWFFHGGGLEGFGDDGAAIRVQTPQSFDDTVWARVDALGICASDAKMVRMGNDYPLFLERDFKNNPALLGHEVSLTVVAVGDKWRDRYQVGQRLGLQPDVFVKGERVIFGVNLPGGMSQFVALGEKVLGAGDDSYVFPLPDELSLADAALLEPWACVEVAYSHLRRVTPKPDGKLWLWGHGGARDFISSEPLKSGTLVTTGVSGRLLESLEAQQVLTVDDPQEAIKIANSAFDDIILLDPESPEVIEQAIDALAPEGCLNLALSRPLPRSVSISANRLHYENLAIVGTTSENIFEAYGWSRNRAELKPGGVLLILGVGGAMGRMHLQRALQHPEPPQTIIACNRSAGRLESIERDFRRLSEDRGITLVTFSPQRDGGTTADIVAEVTDGRGCDDVVVVAPSAPLFEEAAQYLAPGGVLNIFAGVQAGESISLPLDRVALNGSQFFGTSGSKKSDQLVVVDKTVEGTLEPSNVVAAVGGIHAVKDAIEAVMTKRFDGKIVIYPQLESLELLSIEEVRSWFPEVGEALQKAGRWDKATEAALFEACT